jgi:hypothetical protein
VSIRISGYARWLESSYYDLAFLTNGDGAAFEERHCRYVEAESEFSIRRYIPLIEPRSTQRISATWQASYLAEPFLLVFLDYRTLYKQEPPNIS